MSYQTLDPGEKAWIPRKLLSIINQGAAVFFLVATFVLLQRDVVVVERSCATEALTVAKVQEPTKREINAFLERAIAQRFNSGTTSSLSYLSPEEIERKNLEQQALTLEGIDQKILIRDIDLSGEESIVSADRIMGHGDIRAAFPIHIEVSLMTLGRTVENPYGLILVNSKVKEVQVAKEQ